MSEITYAVLGIEPRLKRINVDIPARGIPQRHVLPLLNELLVNWFGMLEEEGTNHHTT